MAHDWLGDLFRRWGRTAVRPTVRRVRFTLAALEDRSVPAVLAPPTQVDPFFVPGPGLVTSQSDVVVSVSGADPGAVFTQVLNGLGAPAFDFSSGKTGEILIDGASGMFEVGLAAGATPAAAIAWLQGRPGVTWAVPDYVDTQNPLAFIPNDPLVGDQYHITKIQADKAWDVVYGANSPVATDPMFAPTVVAITDTGLKLDHPDIAPNLWTNPSPTNGDLHGIDASADPTGPYYGDVSPYLSSHGTHVAGIIAAATDNGIGVAGVAGGKTVTQTDGSKKVLQTTQLMPIRFYGPQGDLSASTLSKAISYAVDHGAKVINSSIITSNFIDSAGTVDPVLNTAFNYLYNKGVIHVIAAGNDSTGNTTNLNYTHGLLVASTTRDDEKSDFSNYGSGVDISAPGTDILSTWANGVEDNAGDYNTISGTSMATPVVSGVVSLIWAEHPDWWGTTDADHMLGRDKVVTQLLATADNIDTINALYAGQLGTGRVNAYRAVTEALAPPTFGTADSGLPAEGGTVRVLGRVDLRTDHRLEPTTVTASSFELRGAGPDGQFGTSDDFLVPVSLTAPYRIGSNAVSLSFPTLRPGKYRLTAFASGPNALKDAFGVALDGNGDGTAGDNFVRTFTAAPALSGTVFENYDGTGTRGVSDPGLAGFTVYEDLNGDGKLGVSEPTAVTGVGGSFVFPTAIPGTYTIRLAAQPGYSPAGSSPTAYTVTVTDTSSAGSLDFGVVRTQAYYGNVFNDLNGDGVRQTGSEPGFPGATLFVDSDGNGKYTPPTKVDVTTYTNAALVVVPDNSKAGSPIVVSGATGQITKVTLKVSADDYLFDIPSSTYYLPDNFGGPALLYNLTLTLVGPDGTRIPITNFLTNADRLVNTTFDSAASTDATDGIGTLNFDTSTAPTPNQVFYTFDLLDPSPPPGAKNFVPGYRPSGDLSALRGLSPNGTWTLEGTDNQANTLEYPGYASSTGFIHNWSLTLTTSDGDQQVVTDGSGNYRFDVPVGTKPVDLQRQRGYALTTSGGYTYSPTASATVPSQAHVFGLRSDTIPPQVLSLAPVGQTVTNSATVDYLLKVSEPLDSLTAASFTLTHPGLTASVGTPTPVAGSPGSYLIRVTTGGGYGRLDLRLTDTTLTDPALNPISGVPVAADLVTVDTLPPTSSLDPAFTPPASGKLVFSDAKTKWPGAVSGLAADQGSGLAGVTIVLQQSDTGLYFDGTSFSSSSPVSLNAVPDPTTGRFSLPVPESALPDGLYTLTESAADLAGNVQASVNSLTFGVDNSPPGVTVSPSGGVLVNTNPIPFVLAFTEPVSGNLAAGLTVTNGTVVGIDTTGAVSTVRVQPTAAGPVTLALAAGAVTDFAGNPNPAASAAVEFDATAPTATVTVLLAGTAVPLNGLAVRPAVWPGAVTGGVSDNLSGVVGVDVAVLRAATGKYYDGTGFSAASPQYLAAGLVTGSGGAVVGYSFPFDAAKFPADGSYQFLVRTTDLAGNRGVSPAVVVVDATPPVPAVVSPAPGALENAAGFSLSGLSGTAADADAGPARTDVAVQRTSDGFYFDGTSFVSASAPLFLAATGTATWALPTLTADRLTDDRYVVTARTTDKAGNVGTVQSAFTFDNTPAVPTGLTPAANSGYNAAGWPGTVSGTVNDSADTAGVQVSLQRQSDGTYWNGSFFGSSSPVFLTATVTLGSGTTPTSFSYPFSSFGFPAEGRYTLTATATDKAGNVSTTSSTFSFDNSPPTTTVTPPGSGVNVFSPASLPTKLTGTAADSLSGVGQVQVSLRQVSTGRYFDGTAFTSGTETKLATALTTPNGPNTGWAFALSSAVLPADGQYVLNAYATDVAGNVQAFGTPYTFGFDATPPQAVVQASKGAVTNVAPLSFTVGFSEPVAALDPTGLSVTNGTVLDVTRKSDRTFTVRVTPASDGAVSLSVTPAAASDAAGNATLPAGPAVGQYDRTPPSLVLTAPAGVLPLGSPVTVTATFSEPVVGFSASSLVPTNATVLGVSGSGTTYQIQLLPSGPGPVGVAVAAGAFVDPAGNTGAASASITRSAEDPRYTVAVGNTVRTYDNRNGLRGQTTPFGDSYTGEVRVASADFNGDGIPDVVAGTGPGGPTSVVVLDGKTFATLFQINPFEDSFTGGVFVAAGDLTGDGTPDLVITPDEGGGPRVRVFDGKTFGQLTDFYGIDDPNFRGGARAAVGDINGDGAGDLIVAAGFGGGPRVAVFDGTTISKGQGTPQKVVGDFFAYEPTLRNGVYVAAGDLDGDGKAELVTAGGPGGGPRVTAYSGSELAAGRLTKTADFFAGDPANRDGVRVAVKQMDANAPADLVVGSGSSSEVRVYTAAGLKQSPPASSFDQELLPGSTGGVFVG